MPRNPFRIKSTGVLGFKKPAKRTLGIRDKQILYQRAKGKCEACYKKIEFSEMQTGHKHAASRGGGATLKNSVCLCWRCNKLQGTDSWATFMKKMGKVKTRTVTSGKARTKKPKRGKKGKGKYKYVIDPITGKKVRVEPLFRI